jgi:hypothetical protein
MWLRQFATLGYGDASAARDDAYGISSAAPELTASNSPKALITGARSSEQAANVRQEPH